MTPSHSLLGASDSQSLPPISHSLTADEKKLLRIPYGDLDMTKVVGVGGFGVVYRAMWKSQRMIVAVKRIQHFETESQELGEEVGKQDLCQVCLLQFCLLSFHLLNIFTSNCSSKSYRIAGKFGRH